MRKVYVEWLKKSNKLFQGNNKFQMCHRFCWGLKGKWDWTEWKHFMSVSGTENNI